MNLNSESFSAYFWSLSQSLGEHTVSLRVLKLDSLDPSSVEEVPGSLVVRCVHGEVGLHNELISLLVEVLRKV